MSVAFEPEPFELRPPFVGLASKELAQASLLQVELLEEIQLEQQGLL